MTNAWFPDRDILESKKNTLSSGQSTPFSDFREVNTLGQLTFVGPIVNANEPGTAADRAYAYNPIGNRLFSEISNTQISNENLGGRLIRSHLAELGKLLFHQYF